jgi:ubiquinone/menaquinone biosynthesis C-methylase UbiE
VVSDVGAGTGALLSTIRAAAPAAKVAALDASSQMLRMEFASRRSFDHRDTPARLRRSALGWWVVS